MIKFGLISSSYCTFISKKNFETFLTATVIFQYVPLMGEAIVLFAGDNVWSRSMERSTKYWIHGVILFISAILVTVGIALMIDEKSGTHFKSIHGWTGT